MPAWCRSHLQRSPYDAYHLQASPASRAPCSVSPSACAATCNSSQLPALLSAVCLRSCGPVAFQVPLEQVDKPSNILEEIVW